MKRGPVTKSKSRLIPVWFPCDLIPFIDDAVNILDTDRSKFIRNAVREKITRSGVGSVRTNQP
jgi:metal-responsive CopG/Arc/MetJ family transcriptional regulator